MGPHHLLTWSRLFCLPQILTSHSSQPNSFSILPSCPRTKALTYFFSHSQFTLSPPPKPIADLEDIAPYQQNCLTLWDLWVTFFLLVYPIDRTVRDSKQETRQGEPTDKLIQYLHSRLPWGHLPTETPGRSLWLSPLKPSHILIFKVKSTITKKLWATALHYQLNFWARDPWEIYGVEKSGSQWL